MKLAHAPGLVLEFGVEALSGCGVKWRHGFLVTLFPMHRIQLIATRLA